MRRNPVDTIRSIIRAHLDHCNSKRYSALHREWFSVKPREWESFRHANFAIQACAQVYYTNQNIEEDINDLGSHRRLVVDFEDVCYNPGKVMDGVAIFLRNHRINVAVKGNVPTTLKVHHKPMDAETEKMIADGIQRFWGKERYERQFRQLL